MFCVFSTGIQDSIITFVFEVVSTQNFQSKSSVVPIYYGICGKSFFFIFLKLYKENLSEGMKKQGFLYKSGLFQIIIGDESL